MKKARYQLNPQTLKLEKVKTTLRQKILRVLWTLSTGMVFAVAVMLIAYSFFSSPKEKALQREVKNYELQFTLMNEKLNNMENVIEDLEERDNNIYRIILEAEPITEDIRNAGVGGVNQYEDLENYKSAELLIETARKIDWLSRRLYVQSKSYDEVFLLAKNKEKLLASIPAIIPIKNGEQKIVSGFGMRMHPILKYLRMHTGIDIASKRGTPVYASADGVVINPAGRGSGYGIRVVLDHGFGYKTMYAHLSKSVVNYGQKVKRGQLIGYVGSTGLSVSPHLHYEVIKNGVKVNPVNYFFKDLTPDEYEEVLEKASQVNQALS